MPLPPPPTTTTTATRRRRARRSDSRRRTRLRCSTRCVLRRCASERLSVRAARTHGSQIDQDYALRFLVKVDGESCDVLALCSEEWLPMYVSSSTKRLEVRCANQRGERVSQI